MQSPAARLPPSDIGCARPKTIVYRGFFRPVLEYGMLVRISETSTTSVCLTAIQGHALYIIGDGSCLSTPKPHHSTHSSRTMLPYKLQFVEGLEMLRPFCHHQQPHRDTARLLVRQQHISHHNYPVFFLLSPESIHAAHSLIATWNQPLPTLMQSPPCRRSMQTYKKKCQRPLAGQDV